MPTEQDWSIYKQVDRLIRSGYDRKSLASLLEVLSTSAEDSARPVSKVLQQLDEIVPDAGAIVRVWNDDTNELEPLLCQNILDKVGCVDMDPQCALPSHVFDTKRPDLTQRAWYYRQLQQEPCLGSCLSVPLIWQHNSVGMASFLTHDERRFTHVEALGLLNLADEIAASIGRSGVREKRG